MCGKFTYIATWAQAYVFYQPLASRPSNAPEETTTPMRFAPVMHLDANGKRAATEMRWAFTKTRNGREFPDNIHARDDRVLDSRLWRPHFEARRGLLIVNSFNEGEEVPTYKPDRVTPTGRTKTVQWTIRPRDGARLAIAVLYREKETAEAPILEFVMCTTPANRGISKFVTGDPDKRMPAVLTEDAIANWLGEGTPSHEGIRNTLTTYEDDGAWDMHPQTKRQQSLF